MSSWSEILDKVNEQGDNKINYLLDLQKTYINSISKHTGRNVITYYSSFLKDSGNVHLSITEDDKNAFMSAIYKMDKSKGLDIILHTPGGNIAATESIINYLHSCFKGDVRAIVPQIAMSAGTMIALSSNQIIMGKQSSLGPVDPQIGGIACGAVIAEFEKATNDIKNNPSSLGLWQVIIAKYHPTFIIACENATKWSKELVEEWMRSNPNKDAIVEAFCEHSNSKSHERHIDVSRCKDLGLHILEMEEDPDLQDLILSLHHCYMILFDLSIIIKTVQNQLGSTYSRTYRAEPE